MWPSWSSRPYSVARSSSRWLVVSYAGVSRRKAASASASDCGIPIDGCETSCVADIFPPWILPGDHLAVGQRGDDRTEDQPPVFAAKYRLGTALRVGHHRGDIALHVDDPGDIAPRTVGIGLRRHAALRVAVAQQHAVIGL